MLSVDLHNLIEAHDQPMVVIDAQYRIVAANRHYCLSHHVSREAIIGRRCHEVSHHSSRPCHENGEQCPHQNLFETGQPGEVVHTHFHDGGEAERVRIKGHPIRSADGGLYLGEIMYHLEVDAALGCAEMRMVGHSPAFLACVDNLARVAESDAPILLYGESGVGKELAAHFVHDRSERAARPFIAINCAAVPENMFETELFGHERGAFTGSIGQKKGLFEMADTGTLFLDEVAEIPMSLQAKLLRVLETGEFRRVGGTTTLRADVRVISATNRNLLDRVDRGRFRQDLYYRLAGIDVMLPALRDRREDIPALAEAILARLHGGKRPACHLDKTALKKLRGYDFPGNVRELRNVLQRALVYCQGPTITGADLRFEGENVSAPVSVAPPTAPGRSLKTLEEGYVRDLLARHNGHRRTVADLLGVSERTLYRKLRQYNLG